MKKTNQLSIVFLVWCMLYNLPFLGAQSNVRLEDFKIKVLSKKCFLGKEEYEYINFDLVNTGDSAVCIYNINTTNLIVLEINSFQLIGDTLDIQLTKRPLPLGHSSGDPNAKIVYYDAVPIEKHYSSYVLEPQRRIKLRYLFYDIIRHERIKIEFKVIKVTLENQVLIYSI